MCRAVFGTNFWCGMCHQHMIQLVPPFGAVYVINIWFIWYDLFARCVPSAYDSFGTTLWCDMCHLQMIFSSISVQMWRHFMFIIFLKYLFLVLLTSVSVTILKIKNHVLRRLFSATLFLRVNSLFSELYARACNNHPHNISLILFLSSSSPFSSMLTSRSLNPSQIHSSSPILKRWYSLHPISRAPYPTSNPSKPVIPSPPSPPVEPKLNHFITPHWSQTR